MVYEIKTPTEYFGVTNVENAVKKLVKEWLASAKELETTADDPKSRRFSVVRGALKDVYYEVPLWDREALTQLVDKVLTAARETIAEDKALAERTTAVVKVINGLLGQGLPSQPGDDDGERPNAWDVLTEQLDAQFKELVDLLGEQFSILAKMHSCQQVLGQLLHRTGDHDHMLLLLLDGQPVALALANGGDIHDLLTKPAHLAAGIPGAGSALMEYIVRRAKAKGNKVSLIPLDSSALRVYTAWGFTGDMRSMVLQPDASDRLLERYKNFAGHVFQ